MPFATLPGPNPMAGHNNLPQECRHVIVLTSHIKVICFNSCELCHILSGEKRNNEARKGTGRASTRALTKFAASSSCMDEAQRCRKRLARTDSTMSCNACIVTLLTFALRRVV